LWNGAAKGNSASSQIFSSLTRQDTPLLNPKQNGSFVAVAVLEVNLFGKKEGRKLMIASTNKMLMLHYSVYLSEDDLRQCTFASRNYLYDSNDRAFLGEAKAMPANRECDPKELSRVISIAESYIKDVRSTPSFIRELQINLQINSLLFATPWQGIVFE